MMSPNNLRFVSVKIIVLTFISLMLSFEEPLANPSEMANGSMSCTVKSNKVINIIEGKSSEYSGFKDGVKVGDALKFEYYAFKHEIGWGYDCLLKDEVRDDLYVIGYNVYASGDSSSATVKVKPDELVFLYEHYRDVISQDSIHCENRFGNLRLKRYYKSDYEGMYIRNPWPDDYTTQVITLDCRTVKDGIQEVIDLFQ